MAAPHATPDHAALLAAMAGRAVLVVGDIMLDRFVTGSVTRLSPEAPVPVLRQESVTQAAGGAGNVLANLTGLGVRAHIVTVTGTDDAGAALRGIIAAQGIDTDGIIADARRPTIVKTRFMTGPHHMLRVDAEDNSTMAADIGATIIARACAVLPRVQALILSDYGKGVLTPPVLRALIDAARAAGIPVLVDPKGADYTRYDGATIVTPNRKELAEAAGHDNPRSDAEIIAAARAVMARAQIDHIVATRSEDGMSVITAAAATHIPTVKLPVFDVAGAGDTVIAVIAAALAAGADAVTAAELANRAGGIVVGKPGTAAITAAELAQPDRAATARQDAATRIRNWQAQGLRVGFTNGCFDILHVGHVAYLQQARTACDRLVVAVNADQSVRRLKGATRPVNPEAARAAVLAALGCVDMVVLFGDEARDEDRPCALLDALRPDVIFKGGDYTEDQLPEAKIVRAYGGDVQIMALIDGFSTTATIAKMQA